MSLYNTYFSQLGWQNNLGVLPNLGLLPLSGRLGDLGEYEFNPQTTLFASGEQGVWYDPSDLTPEKVSWRRNLLTYSQDFENAAWTKSNASILSNLALYSQDFDNAWWFKYRGTLTANNATAPDGTTTADTWTEDTAAGTHEIDATSLTVAANVTMTYQVRVKRSSGSRNFRMTAYAGVDGVRAVFNLDTLVATNGSFGTSTFVSASVVSIGSGWFLCTLTGSIATANPIVAFELVSGTSTVNYTGDGTSGLQFWGAQFLPGSTAQTYTRSLATAAPIQFADPLGGTLADKLVENTANAQHFFYPSVAVAAGLNYTFSIYAKSAERSNISLYPENGTNASANFDLSAGTSTNGSITTNLVSHSITAVGDGWYRCAITFAMVSSASVRPVLYLRSSSGAGSAETYTGNGVNGVLLFGAQLEQASTASAYQRITDFSSDFLAAFPTHALYQESTGVTPVTALGQSVGFVVDKRLGGMANLGPELVTNGTFAGVANGTDVTTLSGWSVYGSPTSRAVQGERLEIVANGVNQGAGLTVTTVVNRTYCLTYTATNFAVGSVFIQNSTPTQQPATAGQIIFTAGSTATLVYFRGPGNAAGVTIYDNISVREVPGNHAIQATSAARPTVQARSNLLTYTEQFDNAAWTKADSATVTANAVAAPDGTTTADQLNIAASELSRIQQGITAVVTPAYTYSVWLRTSSGTATLRFGDASLLSTITVTSDWQRFSQVISGLAGPGNFTIRNESGGGAKTIFAWGAQLELGTTATTYQRVTTATDYADVGLPRNLTFDGIDDSLATAGNVDFATWTVGTRRNLLTVPTMFDDAAWQKLQATITANTTTAPDGTTTADKVVETAASGVHYVYQAPTLAATAYTFSVYAKAAERSIVNLNAFVSPTNYFAYFNLSNGTVGTTLNCTANITNVGSGWYRCSMTFTSLAGASDIGVRPCIVDGNTSYTGDGTSGLFVWGAQLEVGSTATAFQDVGTDKVTLFSGVTKLSDAARGVFAHLGNRSDRTFRTEAPPASLSGFGWYSSGSAAVSGITINAPNAPTTQVYTGLADIAAPSRTLRLNGAQVVADSLSQGTGTFASDIFYVGRRGDNLLFFNGRLFQLVIRGAATDSVTVGNAERWVGQLTGVAL